MSSPFTLFRKHQRAMLAVIGILCMIGFSIGGVGLMDNMSDQPGGANPVVATAYGETLRRGDIEQLISRHITAIRFLAGCDAAQFNLASDSQFSEMLVQRVEGELGPATDRNVVDVWIKAERAKRLGMVVSDDAINAYLRQRTGDRVTGATFRDIAAQMHTGQQRIFEALRMELLARELQEISLRAFQTTPAQRFDYYRRLNQRAVVEVVPVRVEDFTDQVADPPDEELRAFFEEHKEQEPRPESPDPGFKQPKKAAFEVVVAKYDDFNDPSAVTEEQVKEHYEKFKDQRYLFRDFDFLPLDEDKPAEDKSKSTGDGAEDGDDSNAEEGQEVDEQKPDGTKNDATPDSEANDAGAEKDGKSSADDEQSSLGAEATGLVAMKAFGAVLALLASDESSAAKDATFIQTNVVRINGRLASEVADASGAEDKGENEGDGDSPADRDAAGEKPANNDPAAGASSDSADDAAADSAASDEKPSADDDTAGDADQPDAKRKKRTPVVAPQITDELMLHRDIREGEKPKYAPLWRVERTIRRELAAEQATEKMDAALKAVQGKMYRYKQQRGADDSGVARPDLEKLAEQNQLSVVETGLLTAHDLRRKYPELAEAHGERGGITFVDIGYSNRAKFDFSTLTDDAGNRYLFWKTEEEQARVPEFGEIRSQVLRAWKMNKARELAVKRAQELVEKAMQSAEPLKKTFADESSLPVTETVPFSWLTAGGFSMRGRTPPRLSEVEGVEQPGPDFMKEVFNLPLGGVGQAWNQPQTIDYVVRVVSLEPSPDVLRAKFAAEPYSSYAVVAGIDGYPQFRDAWLKGIETEAGLKWHQPRAALEDNYDE